VTKTIDPSTLRTWLHDGGEIALLDVREAGQFGESHLLLATPVPYSQLEVETARLVPRKSARIVVCDDGELGVAQLAGRRLAACGYSDISVLAGGTRAWKAAGFTLFAGVNVPSKLFGELVEHAYHTPRVTAQQLVAMQKEGEDLVIVDGRPFAEYSKMSIPGALCCPNGELPYRILDIVKNPATKIIVNCAGRTRSILGAQTLINFGIPNPVYALENGTQGWFLADLELEHGRARRYPDSIDTGRLPQLQAAARALASRFSVETVSARQVAAWLGDPQRTTYLCDVRTAEEFAAGSLPGAIHAPGGQLIQATDQWIGVRNARIVLFDSDGVRAPSVASWLKQLGCDACVLDPGAGSGLTAPPSIAVHLPRLEAISAAVLAARDTSPRPKLLDLRASMRFRAAHIPGSRWSIRSRLAEDAAGPQMLVLVVDDPETASMAAIDLAEAGHTDIRMLDGGFDAWTSAGLPAEASPATPADDECIDYLFFVHDRHHGNRAAARQYLAWEMNLMSQLDAQERSVFRVSAAS